MANTSMLSIYPTGIVSYKNHEHEDFQPCKLIENLWVKYETRNRDFHSRDFYAEAFRTIYAFFEPYHGFNAFLELQNKLVPVNKTVQRFLNDTVKFIETGKRDAEVSTWVYLIHESVTQPQETKAGYGQQQDKPVFKGKLSDDIDTQFLAKWVAQPNGFNDLMWTLRILFGTLKQ